jgi:hypothetical protein
VRDRRGRQPEGGGRGQRFAGRAPAKVVATPRARRLGDEGERAGACLQLEHGLADRADVGALPVDAASLEVCERAFEARGVIATERGSEVEPLGDFSRAVDDAREGADDDEAHLLALERGQELVRVEGRRLRLGLAPVPACASPSTASKCSTRSLGVRRSDSLSSSSRVLSTSCAAAS